MHRALVGLAKNLNTVMEKNKFILLLGLLYLFTVATTSAQQVKEDPGVKRTRDYYQSYYSQKQTLKGYRIQIVTTTDRRQMEKAINTFRTIHPNIFYEWSHHEPYYKVIVGAYLHKRKAKEALYQFRKDFKGSILVFSDIKKEELIP